MLSMPDTTAVTAVLLLAPLVGLSIGENRKQGLWRALYGAAYYAIIILVGWIFLILYAAVFIIDVGWQILTNRDGLGEDNFAMGVYERQNKLRKFIMGGKGSRNDWRR